MYSEDHDTPQSHDDRGDAATPRPLRFWLKTVARLIAQESATADDAGDIRSRIADAVPAEDYATTVATLEAIARELGWDGEAVSMRGGDHHGPPMGGRSHRPGVGRGRAGDEVHVHVHVHGDREHRGDRHRGHDRGHRRGRCAHAAG